MKQIKAEEITRNPFDLIHGNWGILTAGNEEAAGGMTISWGAVGYWLEKPSVTAYIRPQRNTKKFIDANDRFAISFLPEDMRNISTYFGSVSGADGTDKFAGAGAEKAYEDGIPYIDGADMVFICRKVMENVVDPSSFKDSSVDEQFFADKDYHTIYVAEIEKVLVK